MNKRWLGVVLALLLLTVPAAAAPAEEAAPELTISTAEEFLTFAQACRLDSYSRGLTVSLRADIDLKEAEFDPIPIFSGTFLGNGHTIFGLKVTGGGSAQGLFRYLTAEAVVQELTVQGTVHPGGSRSAVGGIAGNNAGLIRDCVFEGTVSGASRVGGIAGENTLTGTIEACTVRGDIHGLHFVGGVAGRNSGVIRNCTNHALVNTTAEQNQVDISDITLDSLTGAEASATTTDIGGIAGASSGVIRDCENHGHVGYRLMGYNVGGIAGTQSGYITGCVNHAEVLGRKEVGGIVGQMEPAALIRYSQDTLQTLDGQLTVLSDLTRQTYHSTQANLDRLESQLALLRDQADTASAAVDALTPDPDSGQLPDPDAITAAVGALSDAVTAMPGTVRSIITLTGETSASLQSGMQAMVEQVELISRTVQGGEEHLGGSLRDVSDLDTADDLTGKVSDCINHGGVLADLNGGGIAGAMAMENDLDVREDWESEGSASLNFASELRAVILDCQNRGSVTVNKQNAGGVAGWQSLGLVRQCVSTGDLYAEEAEYVGGISGMSLGYIRGSHAKCRLSGSAFVGGIAGSGTVVTGCYSIAQLDGALEQAGAVLGAAEEPLSAVEAPISGNFYLTPSHDPGAIDGISYDGQAQPLPLEDFLALEGLPGQFKWVNVEFLFDGSRITGFSLPLGAALAQELIPQLPEQGGLTAYWEGLEEAELDCILFDLSFEGFYTDYTGVIGSGETRDGLPILLVQGTFFSSHAVTVEQSADLPGGSEGGQLLECLDFSVSGYRELSAARYLPDTELKSDRLTLLVRSADGDWQPREFTRQGRYLVFSLQDGDSALALVRNPISPLPFVLAGGGALVVIGAAVTAVILRRKKKKQAVPEQENIPV